MLDRSRSRDRSKAGGAFSPAGLFVSGAQGAWYDPSDYSTLFQNSTGTTPVTAVEQPVRLMLDRSRGLVLGSELNGDPTLTGNGFWGANAGITVGSGKVSYVSTSVGNALFKTGSFLTAGKTYTVSITVANYVAGAVGVETDAPQNALATGNGTFTFIVRSVSNAFYLTARNATTTLDVTSISVRELPGNHATAPNDASRPVLRSRYNLLTYSEQFDDSGWGKTRTTVTANAATAPNGTLTADKIIATSASGSHYVNQGGARGSVAVRVLAKAAEYSVLQIAAAATADQFANFDLAGGVLGSVGPDATNTSITAVGNGWYLCQCSFASTSASGAIFGIAPLTTSGWLPSFVGDDASGILLIGAQLLTAADQTATGGAYQRVAAATDYDTSNPVWRPYLAFDGSDDSLSTSSIDFSGTDEMTVFAGVTKLSDAAQAVVVGLGNITQAGAFELFAPTSAAGNDFNFAANGGTTFVQAAAGSRPSPITVVASGVMDFALASGEVITRINGASAATSSGNAGSGNFGNYALQVGSRGGSSLRLNGRLYGLTVLGRTATAAELSAMEAWVNGKTGGY